ncbi:MAG: ABC transporter permease subunit [Bacillota bacterium]|nr:ABC transporter permease subunit [Bacillota bacterium]
MMSVGLVSLIIFHYIPMAGIVLAFQDFNLTKGIFGSEFVGMKNFRNLMRLNSVWQAFRNTITIASVNIVLSLVLPIIFALLLNEVRHLTLKRTIQTVVYLPHFISWVILAFTFKQIFAGTGIVNQIITSLGGTKIMFMSSNTWFRPILIATAQWKELGFSTIIYIAAITAIDPNLYEAAIVDGASRFQCVRHITLPGMMTIIVLKATLSLGSILNANFDQIFNMYNQLVYPTSDVIQTYVYRIGLIQAQYSLSTAINLLNSIVGFILIVFSYTLAYKLADYKIF